MNNLNTLLVNEQLNRLKGGTFTFAKVQQQHNAGCKHCYTIKWCCLDRQIKKCLLKSSDVCRSC